MSVATEKTKAAIDRYMLVRLEPARHISDDLASGGGSFYNMVFPFNPVSKVERNGVALTRVDSLSGDDQYTYNETTRVLNMQLASAPNAVSNVIVAYHYMFYTGTETRYTYEDPKDDTTTLREWLPRVSRYPKVRQSIRDITLGVLKVSPLSLTLADVDNDFQSKLTLEDSFANKEITIWQGFSDLTPANIQVMYIGKIKSLSFKNDALTISSEEVLTSLSDDALMGDTPEEAIFSTESGSFPSMHPAKEGLPCRFILGDESKHDRSKNFNTATKPNRRETNLFEAVCTDYYDGSPLVDENREWGLCRVSSAGLRTQDFGTTLDFVDLSGNEAEYELTGHNLRLRDTVKYVSGGTSYYTIRAREDYTSAVDAQDKNVLITGGSITAPADASDFTPLKQMSIYIYSPDLDQWFIMAQEEDYTLSEATTSGGNKYISITFIDDFEAGHGSFDGPLDPDYHRVYFRVTPDQSPDASDVLTTILEGAGLTVDSSAMSSWQSSVGFSGFIPIRVRHSIPYENENSYGIYRKYVQDLLTSLRSYVYVNSEGEVAAAALDAPSTSTVIDDDLIIKDSMSVRINYSDVSYSVRAERVKTVTDLFPDATFKDESGSKTSRLSRLKYLHGTSKVFSYQHRLSVGGAYTSDQIDILGNRRAIYKFSVFAELIDASIGDSLTITDPLVPGGTGTKNVLVTGMTKSVDAIEIEAEDLGELT